MQLDLTNYVTAHKKIWKANNNIQNEPLHRSLTLAKKKK